MDYSVKLTPQAVAQISETVAYISSVLLEPSTAKRWSDCLKNEIASLGSMPSRYPLTDEEPWHTKGIRMMTVKNFLVYYFVDYDNMVVWVTAVIYGRRDRLSLLSEMDLTALD